MLADLDARFPRLADWMKGAKPGQLWNYSMRDHSRDGDAFKEYEALEATLEALHTAAPARLEGKRALHDPGCSCGLNPPASSSDLAM